MAVVDRARKAVKAAGSVAGSGTAAKVQELQAELLEATRRLKMLEAKPPAQPPVADGGGPAGQKGGAARSSDLDAEILLLEEEVRVLLGVLSGRCLGQGGAGRSG